MVRPERIETLHDVKMWIAEHDGRIEAWWDAQREHNRECDAQLLSLERRFTALEKRVVWFAGAAAGLGAVLGPFLKAWLGV